MTSMVEEEFAGLSFSEALRIVVKPPGPKARELLEKQREFDSRAVYYPTVIPTAWESGRGATLKDVETSTSTLWRVSPCSASATPTPSSWRL